MAAIPDVPHRKLLPVLPSLLLCLGFLLAGGGCARLPENVGRVESYAVAQDIEAVTEQLARYDDRDCKPDCSALALLDRGNEAFRWRLALVDMAQRSLDLQYYIWQSDEVGRLLFSRVLQAADRGVRVRLLLDDTAMLGKDYGAAAINAHPNIEIRTFNPFSARGSIWTLVDGFFNLDRLNSRMHNKLLVADNSIGITGGRNIGNNYFGLDKRMNFRDMDILALGPVVEDLSEAFDTFWNSRWSYLPDVFVSDPGDTAQHEKDYQTFLKRLEKEKEFVKPVDLTPEIWEQLRDETRERVVVAPAEVLWDAPDIEDSDGRTKAFMELNEISKQTQREALIVSPYFIPTGNGVAVFAEEVKNGKQIRILTNSLASNDVTATNAGYKNYRRPLVEAGVEIYELRGDAEARTFYRSGDFAPQWLGLHAKVMVFDHEDVFIGTMNLDPRSVLLNTEIGLLIHSPELADQVEEAFYRDMSPENSWRVKIDESGILYWDSAAGRTDWQPARGTWQRVLDWLIPGTLIEDHL